VFKILKRRPFLGACAFAASAFIESLFITWRKHGVVFESEYLPTPISIAFGGWIGYFLVTALTKPGRHD
jgi:hypothetical protein